LDDSYREFRDKFEAGEATRSSIEAAYPQLRARFNTAAMDFCLSSFIGAELDAKTAGDRGLGRVSTDTPRLGAYCRRQLQAMDADEKSTLYFLIQDLMLRGYLSFALLVEDPLRPAKRTTGEDIYQRWIPVIYSSGGRLAQSLVNAIAFVADSAFQSLDSFCSEHAMESVNSSSGKMGQIVAYYATAGAGLRAIEVGNDSR
jgi:hypothetical protein